MYRYGRFCSVVGMAGTDDCNRETVCAIGCHQHFFRFYLVTGILPIGIDQWGAFGYAVIGQWLLVGRGTADKDILPRFILEQADITLHVFCRIANELCNHIVMFGHDGFCHSFFIINIRNDTVNSLRHLFRTTI